MLEDYTDASAAAGGFDRPDAVIERKTPRRRQGLDALTAEAAKFLERIDKIEAEAAKRIAKAGDEGAVDAGVVSWASIGAAQQPDPRVKEEARAMKRTRRASA